MPKALHWIIPVANEMGYFPTNQQARDINCRAAALYVEHFQGKPPRGPMVQPVGDQTIRQAIAEVMQEAAATIKRRKAR